MSPNIGNDIRNYTAPKKETMTYKKTAISAFLIEARSERITRFHLKRIIN
jgi:hypothetical protein